MAGGISSVAPSDYQSLLNHLEGIAVWVVSTPGEFAYVSDGAEDLWGVSAKAIQDDPSVLIERIHPTDRDLIASKMAEAADETDKSEYVTRSVHPDGTTRWVHTRHVPVRDEDGNLQHIVGLCTDITEQKRREIEFEALSRVLRHDIRNDLGVILGWGEMLEPHVTDEGAEYFEKIINSAEHIVELTEIAKDYAETVTREEELEVKPVSLDSILRKEIALRDDFFPNAEFRVTEIPVVNVSANGMLSSVFRNLLNNAVQHNDAENPVVEITCELRDEDVIVRVADNGPGIPADVGDSLFQEGMKGIDSSGTGMGLYLVHTLVEQYEGDVWITDNSPRGTVFHVRLPRSS